MEKQKLIDEIERVLSKTSYPPSLVRGTSVHNLDSLFSEGKLLPINSEGSFFFWPVAESLKEYSLAEDDGNGRDLAEILKDCEGWAKDHTLASDRNIYLDRKNYTCENIGDYLRDRTERLAGMVGAIIEFNLNIFELNPFSELCGKGSKVSLSEPVEIISPEGIEICYIASISPIGCKDKKIIRKKYLDLMDTKD